MKRIAHQHGFTLLELILAMGMVSMLALTLYTSLQVAFKAKESALAAIGPARTALVALDMIKRDLEAALPPTGVLAGAFIGEPTSDAGITASGLEFYTMGTSPNYIEAPMSEGIRKVELAVQIAPQDRTRVLVRRITTNLLAPQTLPPEEEILCRGVHSFAVRFFDGTQWMDQWDSTQLGNILPVAVEVTLDLDWPPLKQPADSIYRVSQVFMLPCHQDAQDDTTSQGTSTSAGTGASQGAGGQGATR
jgi:type II secretion system protein J